LTEKVPLVIEILAKKQKWVIFMGHPVDRNLYSLTTVA